MSLAEAAAVPVPHVVAPLPAQQAAALPSDEPAAGQATAAVHPSAVHPAAAPAFLDELPPEMVDAARLPLSYRLATLMPFDGAASTQRATPDPGQTGALLACNPFYKPISRCVGGRG
ncbi:MAG TPA: hypothetical protein VFE05_09515 [Longimicrobiaceae bacterium]|jgi:hypothetical protein|nr:hypothetical protein [Longimicrobiaceae bacterium]